MSTEKIKTTLRQLAEKVREIAENPVMDERRKLWYGLNALNPERPMVLCYPEESWKELITQSDLTIEQEPYRSWEMRLRRLIYWWENINDDNVLEKWFDIPWEITVSDFGIKVDVKERKEYGSFSYVNPITDLRNDFEKLHLRNYTVNRASTEKKADMAADIFGDILPVRIRGTDHFPISITWEAIKLIGMNNMFLYMYDDPDILNKLMEFLRDDKISYYKWLESEGILTLNNENDYVGTGGVGYTHELPKTEEVRSGKVKIKDLWGTSDSQETVGVSPQMFYEFVLKHQIEILNLFGLNCYGCCEPLHDRWELLKNIPNLRRVSVSPWCDQEKMSGYLGKNYIFSRKPNPVLVSVMFDEEEIRKDLRNTLRIAKDNVLEIIMKDVHTVGNEPWRITRWVEIAKEEVRS